MQSDVLHSRGKACRTLLAITAGSIGVATGAAAQTVRPETGALLGMQRLTDSIFVHSMDDRIGSGSGSSSSTWLRAFGEGSSSTSDSGLYDVDGKFWGLQGGFDLPGPPRAANWRFGVMASLGGARADGTAVGTARTSEGKGQGGGLGLYGTWFQDPSSRLGWYADFWGHYAWFDNQVDTSGVARVDYRSHNSTASAETGYAFAVGSASGWTLTPQFQWIYLHNHSYNFVESDGTSVEGAHRGAWSSRLGLRLQQQAPQPGTPGGMLRPYVAVNWWHDASGDEVIYNKAQSIKDLYPKDRIELKGGAAMALGRQWIASGDLGWQTGSQSFSAWTARVGARYSW